ncbi:MAG: FAD-dependent oxidoreductase [Actinobacteria bacterium]|nr:FAD-dependent oxidoreductase [Actinomycetota bacterium]
MQVELLKKIKESEETFSFIFKPDEEVSWEAGQFIFFRIPHKNPDNRGTERHFTIASAPDEKVIRLTTKFDFEKGSTFKKALYDLEPGNSIEAFGIKGNFIIKDPYKKYILIAGGIGITPYRAMLLDFAYKGIEPDIKLIYGNKNADVIFKDTLDRLESGNKWLKVNYVIEPQLIDKEVIRRNTDDVYNGIYYYVSGPMGMVKNIKSVLLNMNIDKDNIDVDYFPGYSD